MKGWGIKSKVVLLVVLPVCLITTWLAYDQVQTRFETLDTTLNIRGDTIARNLARASEVAILSRNQELLDQLSFSTLLEEDVISVEIRSRGNIMRSSARQSPDTPVPSDSAAASGLPHDGFPTLLVRQPILLEQNRSLREHDFSLLYQSDPRREPNDIGLVFVEMSTATVALAKRDALFTTLLATLVALVLTIALGLAIGRAITRPIVEMSEAVEQIEQGNLDIHLKELSGGELRTLQVGLTSMADTIKASQHQLIDEVEHATKELRGTLTTIEQQNVALERARKMEEDANKAKSEFLANISHEIRTPMNAVIGFAHILKNTPLDEQQTEYVSTIEKSGEHLVNIINDILDLSRIEAGKLSINPIDFDLRNCLEEVIQLLAPQAHDNNNELVMLVYNDVPDRIHGDPLRIKQIVLNLLHNALKCTTDGSVILRVMYEERDGDSIVLGINVEDTGIGMTAAEVGNLFTAYASAQHSDRRRSGGGAGLGLAITQKLVQSMHGGIEVDSTPHEGTVFHCHIQVGYCRTEDCEKPLEKRLQGKRIALFENHDATRLAITHMLNRAGAKLELNEPGTIGALQRLSSLDTRFDAVLLSLPRDSKNEVGLLEALAAVKATCKCLLVARIERPALESYQRYGVKLVLNKPVREDNLVGSLARQLAGATKVRASSGVALQAPAHNVAHVLIADDHDINLRVVSNFLQRRGFTMEVARDGGEAIAMAATKPYDMILMDIHMPGVNGIDAVKRIRAESVPNRNTPIIALTADAVSITKSMLNASGFSDRLIKPVTENELIHQMDRYLSQSAEADSSDSVGDSTAATLAEELLEILIKELPENSVQLADYRAQKDWESMRELAHRLHSACCFCHIPVLKARAKSVELAIINDSEPEKILESCEALQRAIETVIADHKAGTSSYYQESPSLLIRG